MVMTKDDNNRLPPLALRVDADLLIPGRGEPIVNGTLVCGTSRAIRSCDIGKIMYAGPTAELPAQWSELAIVEVPVLMPGLWDCHVRE